MPTELQWWQVALLGCLGGLGNLALSGDFFRWPMISRQGFRLGFLNPVLIGAVAALATFWLGDLSKLDFGHQAGLSLAAGVSGATVLAGLSQRRRAQLNQGRAGFFRDAATGFSELDGNPPEGGGDPTAHP
jgi:uncharacterized membrane protein YeaQ/YmgE (transglycosylase-associated protein family)